MFTIWYLMLAVCSVSLAASSVISRIDCGMEKFPCDSGNQCVDRQKWCNKHSDCDDKSDEAYCKKAGWFDSDPNECSSKTDTHILCGTGICFPLVAECDGVKDCRDGFDEKYCEKIDDEIKTTDTSPIETSSNEDRISSEDESTTNTASTNTTFPLNSEETNHSTEDRQGLTNITLTKLDADSSKDNGYRSIDDYYDKRMREANSEIPKIPLLSFPNQIPTRAHPSTRSMILETKRTTISTTTQITTTKSPSRSVSSISRSDNVLRSQVTSEAGTINQQRQSAYQHTNHYRPPINHYRLPTYRHQPSANNLPLNSRYQPPSSNYQIPSQSYQSSSNHYQSHGHPFPPNHNNHRTPNRQPDFPHQTNYFSPYSAGLETRRPFYFATSYGSLYGWDNARSLDDGRQWLLRQRSGSGDWGKDTPRAVVALALSSNDSFLNSNNGYEIIKRRFMVQLGAEILKNNTNGFNVNKLFMAINGLLAVCEDPTDFHGVDLTEMLRRKMRENSKSYQNPFVSLSLCLSNKSLTTSEVHNLMKKMHQSINMNERTKDMLISAIMAFSCYIHQHSLEHSNYVTSLRNKSLEAVSGLLDHMSEDGSFGSVYSTALAAQALISTNESSSWKAEKTMSFLRQQQREDGSFGDFLATYWVLPALNGKSLLHLRNINCHPIKRELTPEEILEFTGPKQYVNYFLYFGYPIVNSQSQLLFVPQGIHFLDVMRVAEYQDPNFRFVLEKNSTNVYSMSGLPNDPELGLSWHFYVKQESNPHLQEPNIRERYTGDLRSLSPKSGELFVFWYHSNDIY